MNSLGDPTHVDDLVCVKDCPALREPMLAGAFLPSWLPGNTPDEAHKPEHVARYRFPSSREAYIFQVQPCRDEGRWYAWGEWAPQGRKVADACYQFLDGGGTFSSRSAAEWAIHVYIAHLHANAHLLTHPCHAAESVC